MGIGQQFINGTYGGHEAPPKTAYEELKAWCEKHLQPQEFTALEESFSFLPTIYINCDGYMTYLCFAQDGSYAGSGEASDDDLSAHAYELDIEMKPIRPNY